MGAEFVRAIQPAPAPAVSSARPVVRRAVAVAPSRHGVGAAPGLGRSGLRELQRGAGNLAVQHALQQRPAVVARGDSSRTADDNVERLGRRAHRSVVPRPEVVRRETDPPGPAPAAPGPAAASGAPAAEPTIQVEPAAKLGVVEQASKNSDWGKLTARLTQRGIDDPEMLERCAEYVLAMTAPKPQMSKVKYLLALITDRLSTAGAFDHRTGDDRSADYSNKFNLWSGVKEQAAEYGNASGGVALETSAAGSLFDGLTFGMKWNDALTHQWNELSRLYAEGIRGEVHIHQYRGVRGGSVFNKVEYPTIKDSIAIGAIEPVIHLYANWGNFTGMVWGAPTYGGGDKGRREEKVLKGASALESFMGNKWEFSDATELQGGYWPAGKGGPMIDSPDGKSKIKAGEEW